MSEAMVADDVLQRLAGLGLALPAPPRPMGAYRATVTAGAMLHVAMQGPLEGGRPTHRGLVGRELSTDEGARAARQAMLNVLAQMQACCGGFAGIRQIVRVEGYVACTDTFLDHPAVLDGASDLLAALFGERAGHVRLVCGVRNLPGNVPVAVALTAELSVPPLPSAER